jgi:nicotinate-nucleotide--dimethylbenzimidazole phosphoribosyltransferase
VSELRELAAGRRAAARLARALDVPLRLVDAGVVGDAQMPGVVATGLPPGRDPRHGPALTTEEVAAAVDAGRELAAAAARDGATVVAAGAIGTGTPVAATSLAALLTGLEPPGGDDVAEALAVHRPEEPGPLGALRRLGSGAIAVVCGVALGAGEHGLGVICDGLAATAGAAVAASVEPEVRPRLVAAEASPERTHAALLAHLGLEPVLAPGTGASGGGAAAATLALLRLAAAVTTD